MTHKTFKYSIFDKSDFITVNITKYYNIYDLKYLVAKKNDLKDSQLLYKEIPPCKSLVYYKNNHKFSFYVKKDTNTLKDIYTTNRSSNTKGKRAKSVCNDQKNSGIKVYPELSQDIILINFIFEETNEKQFYPFKDKIPISEKIKYIIRFIAKRCKIADNTIILKYLKNDKKIPIEPNLTINDIKDLLKVEYVNEKIHNNIYVEIVNPISENTKKRAESFRPQKRKRIQEEKDENEGMLSTPTKKKNNKEKGSIYVGNKEYDDYDSEYDDYDEYDYCKNKRKKEKERTDFYNKKAKKHLHRENHSDYDYDEYDYYKNKRKKEKERTDFDNKKAKQQYHKKDKYDDYYANKRTKEKIESKEIISKSYSKNKTKKQTNYSDDFIQNNKKIKEIDKKRLKQRHDCDEYDYSEYEDDYKKKKSKNIDSLSLRAKKRNEITNYKDKPQKKKDENEDNYHQPKSSGRIKNDGLDKYEMNYTKNKREAKDRSQFEQSKKSNKNGFINDSKSNSLLNNKRTNYKEKEIEKDDESSSNTQEYKQTNGFSARPKSSNQKHDRIDNKKSTKKTDNDSYFTKSHYSPKENKDIDSIEKVKRPNKRRNLSSFRPKVTPVQLDRSSNNIQSCRPRQRAKSPAPGKPYKIPKESPNKVPKKDSPSQKMLIIRYQINSDPDILTIELDPKATVKTMRKEIANSNDVEIGDVKIIFAGKQLLDDISLKSLNVGDSVLFVYIQFLEEVLLLTAKALKV